MCNAWNHSRKCNCGGGGVYHGGSGRRQYAWNVGDLLANAAGRPIRWQTFGATLTRDSFTVPNAECPVCG